MDDDLKRAMALLLENKWIIRSSMPEEYMLVRKYEKKLQGYFREKCGWMIIVNQRFYKLEKIPAQAEGFMGIEAFQTTDDYVLLCCTMAFLEEQEIDGQFLLSSLCEALMEYYPNEGAFDKLNWESYNWRRALIRVINYLLEINVLCLVEDNSEAFLSGDFSEGRFSGEALYEVTTLARYFLRSYPKDLYHYKDIDSLYEADFMDEGENNDNGLRCRRNNVYRKLLLSPVYYKNSGTAEEFLYLRKVYQRINEEFINLFDLDVQLYNDCAMAVSTERSTWFRDVFPSRMKGLHDVILNFSTFYQEIPDWRDKKILSFNEFAETAAQLSQAFKNGWTKEFREMGRERLAKTILIEMLDWGMADFNEKEQLIMLQPALFRLIGKYPDDYKPGGKEVDK